MPVMIMHKWQFLVAALAGWVTTKDWTTA